MSNLSLQTIKQNLHTKLKTLDKRYEEEEFIEYLLDPIEKCKTPLKAIYPLSIDLIQIRWEEYSKKNVKDLLQQNYEEYSQLDLEEYLEYIYELMKTGEDKYSEIYNSLRKAESLTPPYWNDFLKNSLEESLWERLENLREDPEFPQYFKLEKLWLEKYGKESLSKCISSEEPKPLNALYVIVLEKEVYQWIYKKLYLYFRDEQRQNFLNVVERDLNNFKKTKGKITTEKFRKESISEDSQISESPTKEAYFIHSPPKPTHRNHNTNDDNDQTGEKVVKKKMKVNPSVEKEVNLSSEKYEPSQKRLSFIKPCSLSFSNKSNPFEKELREIIQDNRFKIEKLSLDNSESIELVVFHVNDGLISFYDKIFLTLQNDHEPKIHVRVMPNLTGFFVEYEKNIEEAATRGDLKQILELWLHFKEENK